MTDTYSRRVPPPRYTPRLVTEKPEYVKEKWGECHVCPERIQAECRDRQLHHPGMPMMCEVWDQLDVLTSGTDEKVLKKILRNA